MKTKLLTVAALLLLTSCSAKVTYVKFETSPSEGSTGVFEFHANGSNLSTETLQRTDAKIPVQLDRVTSAASGVAKTAAEKVLTKKTEPGEARPLQSPLQNQSEVETNKAETKADVKAEAETGVTKTLKFHKRTNGDRPTWYGLTFKALPGQRLAINIPGCAENKIITLNSSGEYRTSDGWVVKNSDTNKNFALLAPRASQSSRTRRR